MKIALLDDYQGVALTCADWKGILPGADITVFRNSYVFGWGGTWFFIPSSGSCPAYATPFSQPPVSVACYKQWGLPGDVPVG